jgi:hypothetical protein
MKLESVLRQFNALMCRIGPNSGSLESGYYNYINGIDELHPGQEGQNKNRGKKVEDRTRAMLLIIITTTGV